MDSSAAGAYVGVSLHEVDQLDDGVGLEVDVSVEGQEVGVLGSHLFLGVAQSGGKKRRSCIFIVA